MSKESVRISHVKALVEPDLERKGITMADINNSVEGMYTCLSHMMMEKSEHWRRGLVEYSKSLEKQAKAMNKRVTGLRRAVSEEVRKE